MFVSWAWVCCKLDDANERILVSLLFVNVRGTKFSFWFNVGSKLKWKFMKGITELFVYLIKYNKQGLFISVKKKSFLLTRCQKIGIKTV